MLKFFHIHVLPIIDMINVAAFCQKELITMDDCSIRSSLEPQNRGRYKYGV